jgi:pilus assembly protein Flp/PilA
MIAKVKSFITNIAHDEQGASLVEYSLLIALLAVVCIVAITAVGSKANTKFNNVSTNLN